MKKITVKVKIISGVLVIDELMLTIPVKKCDYSLATQRSIAKKRVMRAMGKLLLSESECL